LNAFIAYTLGTVVACSYEAGLVGADGESKRIDRMLGAGAAATMFGALMGTSPTTTYIESGAGIAAGGRTGLTSVVTGLCFMLTLLVTPLIASVPASATAPALIPVGVLMFKSIRHISFEDLGTGIPAFLTIIMMPLSYNISSGLSFGFASSMLLAIACGHADQVHPPMWAIGLMSMINLALG
jgi:AGZA family xanthine/uracil permease-like MFS transporter